MSVPCVSWYQPCLSGSRQIMSIKLHFQQTIAVDPQQAWQSLHDDLCLLSAGLPNVHEIRERQRRAAAVGPAAIDYIWSIERQVVPAAARPFLRSLLDEVCADTLWHPGERRVEFLFYSEQMNSLFSCRGHFLLTAAPLDSDVGTQMTISANLDVAPDQLPGVPKLLARSIMPAVERSVRDVIGPSLEALPEALYQLIHQRQPSR